MIPYGGDYPARLLLGADDSVHHANLGLESALAHDFLF